VSTQHTAAEINDAIIKSNSAPGTSDVKVIRVRQSRPVLSTVVSSGSGVDDFNPSSSFHGYGSTDENAHPQQLGRRSESTYTSTQSTTSDAQLRAPLSSSDMSSLNCLQDLVSPGDLLKSRFVSAPLVEAKIRLPPQDNDEARTLRLKPSRAASRFSNSGADEQVRVPFDHEGVPVRDPRFRWSVDF
jgi:hypothetical protein